MNVTDGSHRLKSNKVIHITTKPQCAQKDTLFPEIPQRAQCLLIEKGGTSHTFSSFLPSQCVFFCLWVWRCGVMINTTRHGKRVALTIEGVVLVHKPTVSPVSASQAQPGRSLGANGWHSRRGGKKCGYLIIIICRITQKLLAMGKQIKQATLLNQARSKVLNWV